MSKKKPSLDNFKKKYESDHSSSNENDDEELNITQKTTKSQDFISSKAKSEIVPRSVHTSKSPNQHPDFNIPNKKMDTSTLSNKEREVNSKLQQLEKEVSDNEIKFTNQPILLLNIDNTGKILLNKKPLHLLKKITTYVIQAN